MNLPEKDHPLWSLLRTAVVGAIAVFALHFNYSGLDSRDVLTVVEVMLVAGGMDLWTKRNRQQ